MHIIIDCTSTQDQLKNSGIGNFTRNVVLELVKQNPNERFSLLLFDYPSSLDSYKLEEYNNVEFVSVGSFHISNYLNYVWFKIQIEPVIKRIASKNSIFFTSYFWRYFPKDKYVKTVVQIQDLAPAKLNVYSDKNPVFDKIRKLQYWHAMNRVKHVDLVTTNLEHTKNDFLSYFPKFDSQKIFPIELGLDVEFSECSDNKDSLLDKYLGVNHDWRNRGYIIYLGADIHKTKNSEAVVLGYAKFVEQCRKSNNNAFPYLVIAGKEFINFSRGKTQEFHNLVNKCDLKDLVIFTGFYEDCDRYILLKNAKCFVHFSKYEGFGLALVEAMVSKVPIVASNIYPYRYILQGEEFLIDPDNYDQIGQTMYNVITGNSYSQDLAQKRYLRSGRFSWKETAKTLMSIFKKLDSK